jgi:hypothetical protein
MKSTALPPRIFIACGTCKSCHMLRINLSDYDYCSVLRHTNPIQISDIATRLFLPVFHSIITVQENILSERHGSS